MYLIPGLFLPQSNVELQVFILSSIISGLNLKTIQKRTVRHGKRDKTYIPHLEKTNTITIESQVFFVCKDGQLGFDHEKLETQNEK